MDIISTYINERVATRSFTKRTAVNNRYILRAFIDCCPDDFARTRRRHVVRWMESQGHCTTATIGTRLGTVRAFTKWATARGLVAVDPCASIDTPTRPRRQPRAMDADDIELLLSTAPDSRLALALSLMVCEGLRLSEATGLQVGDLDWVRRTVTVIGKGDKQRTVHMTPATADAVRRYLSEWPATSGPLIRSAKDGVSAVTSSYIGKLVTDHMRANGLKGWARDGRSAHALRHTYASDLVDAGATIVAVAELMGHANVQTTMIYQRGIRLEEVRRVVEGRPYACRHRAS
jgi:integrase/recombinase XerC